MRDNIILLGANHARTPISFRERLALSVDSQREALVNRPSELAEIAILSTCNRTEFYAFVSAGLAPVQSLSSWVAGTAGVSQGDLANATYSWGGRDAIMHLFNVSSGLDSMVLGEPHILGQVRNAFERALEIKASGPILSRLGQDAVHLGKLVRTQTHLARNRQSIPHAAVDLASRHLRSGKCRAVVIGAGEMGTLSAKILRSSGIDELVIVNRDEAKGQTVSRAVNARFAPFSNLQGEIDHADLVISAVEFDGFVVQSINVQPSNHDIVLIDLGVPRTIDPALRASPGVRLFDIDDLERGSADSRQVVESDVEIAKLMVESACDEFLQWWAARESAPAIAALTHQAERIRDAELERALRKLDHLSDRDRNVVAALSVGIVNKVLHQPISTLRGSLDGGETADLTLKLFGLAQGSTTDQEAHPVDARSTTTSEPATR